MAQTKEASSKEEVKIQTIKDYKELIVKLEAVKVELQKLGVIVSDFDLIHYLASPF
ncbi:MAG: hypothetical protein MRQ13_05545 [Candidatus Midichloria sp.]|nr:hypothetical protein [Candidatus Midichloria sp.]